MKRDKIKLGITIGDTNGVGGELILKTFLDKRMYDFCTPIVFASDRLLSFQKKALGIDTSLFPIKTIPDAKDRRLNVINAWNENVTVKYGTPTKESGFCAFRSLDRATKSLKSGDIEGLVTAPIDKHNIQGEGFRFSGHTDYLGHVFEGQPLMFMVSDELRLALLTDHVPVDKIVENLSTSKIQTKLDALAYSLKHDFLIPKPKVAMLSVNPHCGDGGLIGTEDDTILKPIIEKRVNEGELIFGPYSADGFFASGSFVDFDAVVATYHDQGLIPFKYIAASKGVNFTAGLSVVRTSPAHGTAFDIAGKGKAEIDSFRESIFKAIEIVRNRNSQG